MYHTSLLLVAVLFGVSTVYTSALSKYISTVSHYKMVLKCLSLYLHQMQPSCEKGCSPQGEKVVKSKVATKKWLQ